MRQNRLLMPAADASGPTSHPTSQPSHQAAIHPTIVVTSRMQLVRDAVRTALSGMGFVVLSFAPPSGAEQLRGARRRIGRARPLAGLLVSELENAAQVRETAAVISELAVPWLVMTARPPGPLWGAMLEVGAQDVIGIATSLDDLSLALRALSAGTPVPDTALRTRVRAAWRDTPEWYRRLTRQILRLSPREMEILVELNDGYSTRTIAARSGVSESTVRSQIRGMMRKLEVTSQLQAVAAYRGFNDRIHRGR